MSILDTGSLTKMLPHLNPFRMSNTSSIGLYCYENRLYFGLLNSQPNEDLYHTIRCFEFDGFNSVSPFIKEYVADNKLQKISTNLILSNEYYEIFLLEDLANLPSRNKHEAIQWKMAEFLDYPCEDAIVEYIELPSKANTSSKNQKLYYALAIHKKVVEQIINWTRKHGLNLQSIDIWQNTIKHILPQDDITKGSIILRVSKKNNELLLIRDGEILLVRNLEIDFNELSKEKELKTSEQYENLSLEIQRTIDYCASNLKNPGISQVLLSPDTQEYLDKEKLEAILGIDLKYITLKNSFDRKWTMPELICLAAAHGQDYETKD